ncbi:hypothetical protein AMTRI_Chr01g130950 [Amborella trichopoda]
MMGCLIPSATPVDTACACFVRQRMVASLPKTQLVSFSSAVPQFHQWERRERSRTWPSLSMYAAVAVPVMGGRLWAVEAVTDTVETPTSQEEGEEEDDGEEGEGASLPTPPTKLKTGKAALPLKRDRRRSKRFLEIQKLRENKQEYDLRTAISLLKKTANTKFVETTEAHFRLNIDPKYNDQQLRATVSLPKGTGQTVRIAVLTQGEKFDEAKNAGADIVGGEELIQQIKGGFMEFDKLIASPDMMPKAIAEFKKGKVEYRADKTGIVHLPFGKVEFSEEDLLINLMAAIKSIEANKPSGAKGVYWKSAHICSSMGPSIRLNVKEMVDYKLAGNWEGSWPRTCISLDIVSPLKHSCMPMKREHPLCLQTNFFWVRMESKNGAPTPFSENGVQDFIMWLGPTTAKAPAQSPLPSNISICKPCVCKCMCYHFIVGSVCRYLCKFKCLEVVSTMYTLEVKLGYYLNQFKSPWFRTLYKEKYRNKQRGEVTCSLCSGITLG